MLILAVFTGGALGSILRYFVSARTYQRFGHHFPYGTLAVNLIASFLLGLMLPIFATGRSESIAAFVTTGILGGLGTFSTLSVDALLLARDGKRGRAAVYATMSLLFGVLMVVTGVAITTMLR
jgi:CrcB protein